VVASYVALALAVVCAGLALVTRGSPRTQAALTLVCLALVCVCLALRARAQRRERARADDATPDA
jgi:hypothetical protein